MTRPFPGLTWAIIGSPDGTTAFREGDQHTISAFDRQMAVAGLRRNIRRCVTLLEVLRYHHAHGIPEADFREQIVKRGELHALKLTLDALLRDLSQFTAAA